MWFQGTYDRYAEIGVPLTILWFAVIAPYAKVPAWYFRLRKLKDWHKVASKRSDEDELKEIEEQVRMLLEWHTPATVGAVKAYSGKYGDKALLDMWEIDRRIRRER
jgi:hypothetical protein